MKTTKIILLSGAVLMFLASCSPYKNAATTPDDVYYSPGQPVVTTVTNPGNSEYYSTPNDNYVKMRVQNPDKWAYFDDYNYDYYGSSAYGYGYGSSIGLSMGFGFGYGSYPCYGGFGYYSPMSYYNSYYAWNNFYNPYYGHVIVVNGKNTSTPGYARMSNFNPTAYKGNYYNSRPSGMTSLTNSGASTRNSQTYYNTRNNNNNYNTNNSNNNNFYRPSSDSRNNFAPTRSASPSNFGSGGGGGGGSRGGGFSRPGR